MLQKHSMAKVSWIVAMVAAIVALFVPAAASAGNGNELRVMTRNLYLGADLGPALGAGSTNEFIRANGQILRDVDTNNFPVRAKGLAREILAKDPDLVGLQEVSLWRTGPVDLLAPITGNFTASTVRYDYLDLLMNELNKGRDRYRVVTVQQEFDFEAPGDLNGIPGDGNAPGINDDGEMNGRLTMRDAILAKTGGNVKTSNEGGGNFETLYSPVIAGIPIDVERGWTQVDARVRGHKPFRFVNTHFEAFGDPTIREAQAKELVAPGGPAANGDLPVVLVGDLNSDDNTVSGGDRLAYNALIAAGMLSRSTENPMSCCLNDDILLASNGSPSDFDHHIDHVLTDDPAFRLVSSSVSGLAPENGYWNSDHAGVFSALTMPTGR